MSTEAVTKEVVGDMARVVAEVTLDGSRHRRFSLVGPDGAVSFTYTDRRPGRGWSPYNSGVWAHYFEDPGHAPAGPEECDLLPTGRCWTDGSYLAGDEVVASWKPTDDAEPNEGLWEGIAVYYRVWFQGSEG